MLRASLALSLAFLLVALLGGCGESGPNGPETSLELPSIIEPVPESPTTADEGEAGTWEALPGLDVPARAFIVGPETQARGGLLLVHAPWGVNKRFRDLARRFAEEGFFVVAPDLFEGVYSTSRLTHQPLVQGVEAGRAAELLLAAESRLDSEGFAAEARSALGVGVGGNWVALGIEKGLEAHTLILDTSIVDESTLPAALEGRTLTYFVGSDNRSFEMSRLLEMDDLVSSRGGRLDVRRIEGAGATLLDERAMGFSGIAFEAAFAEMTALMDPGVSEQAD